MIGIVADARQTILRFFGLCPPMLDTVSLRALLFLSARFCLAKLVEINGLRQA